MDHTLTQDTLAITSTAGRLSYEEIAEEFWETPVMYTRTAQTELIPENEWPTDGARAGSRLCLSSINAD
jgi:hypothetical protein